MRRLLGLLLLLAWCGAARAEMSMGGGCPPDVSGCTATSTGSTTGRTLAARFADVMNVLDYGARCDGSTSDQTAIQNTINAAAGKARVYVPANSSGLACMVTKLNVPSNSHIVVDGILKLSASANVSSTAYVFSIPVSTTKVTIEGHGTLDGNSSNLSGSNFGAGIVADTASYITVRDVTITNQRNWPVNLQAVSHCYLDGVKMITAGNSAQFGTNTTDCWAHKLYVTGISDEAWAFYGGVTYSGITDSYIASSSFDGISVLNDSGSSPASHHLVIANNVVTGMQQAGISIAVGSGGVGQNYQINIANNVLTGNGAAGGGKCGIYLANAFETSITNNRIDKDLGTNGTQCIGIWLQSSNMVDMRNNIITDEGQTTGAIGTGVRIETSNSNIRATNNTLWDTQGSHTMVNGFTSNGTLGAKISIIDNVIAGVTTPYLTTWASDSVFRPTIPTTQITVSGGTLTASANTDKVILSTGTNATFTLTLPAVVRDDQVLTLQCDISVTSLTIAGNGNTVVGAPSACSATQGHQFRYRAADTSWRMDY